MREACAEAGWQFQRTGGPRPVLAANVRWLAGYRHPRCLRPAVAETLTSVLGEPKPLLGAAMAAGDTIAVLPVLYHLMWRQVISADLEAALLGPVTAGARSQQGSQPAAGGLALRGLELAYRRQSRRRRPERAHGEVAGQRADHRRERFPADVAPGARPG